jgi:hypothetical protein
MSGMPLFIRRVGASQQDHVDVPAAGGFLAIALLESLHGGGLEPAGAIKGPVHVAEPDAGEPDRLKHPVELQLRVQRPVEVVDQGCEYPAGRLGCGGAGMRGQGRRKLGVVAILPPVGIFACASFQVKRQEDMVGP